MFIFTVLRTSVALFQLQENKILLVSCMEKITDLGATKMFLWGKNIFCFPVKQFPEKQVALLFSRRLADADSFRPRRPPD